MRDIIINYILIPALQELYRIDYDNIRMGVSERNICARLALHMENIMRLYDERREEKLFSNYFVDVEYNRMGNGNIKKYENSEKRPKTMVSDLLIQSRGEQHNYLAVEMKRKGNKKNIAEDKERLEAVVSPKSTDALDNCVYDTLVGAFITFSSNDVMVEFYENENGKGRATVSIELEYVNNRLEIKPQ